MSWESDVCAVRVLLWKLLTCHARFIIQGVGVGVGTALENPTPAVRRGRYVALHVSVKSMILSGCSGAAQGHRDCDLCAKAVLTCCVRSTGRRRQGLRRAARGPSAGNACPAAAHQQQRYELHIPRSPLQLTAALNLIP